MANRFWVMGQTKSGSEILHKEESRSVKPRLATVGPTSKSRLRLEDECLWWGLHSWGPAQPLFDSRVAEREASVRITNHKQQREYMKTPFDTFPNNKRQNKRNTYSETDLDTLSRSTRIKLNKYLARRLQCGPQMLSDSFSSRGLRLRYGQQGAVISNRPEEGQTGPEEVSGDDRWTAFIQSSPVPLNRC